MSERVGSSTREHTRATGPYKPESVGIPPRLFLYTLDQVAQITALDLNNLKRNFIYYDGRTPGKNPKFKMVARNIAPPHQDAEWRVAEKELIRWLRRKGFKVYERGWVEN